VSSNVWSEEDTLRRGATYVGTDIARTGYAISRFVDKLNAGQTRSMLHWEQKQGVCST
jgi:hypothetical protein